jgi:hypothetical protein
MRSRVRTIVSVLSFGAFGFFALTCGPPQGDGLDEESQLALYEAALRAYRSGDPRPLRLSDTLMFDSLKAPKRLPPSIPRELARRGVTDSVCNGRMGMDCVTVRVSLPILTGRDSAQVYVASADKQRREYTTRTYRFVRTARDWALAP